MLALSAEVGDVCVRTDINKSFILKEAGASTLSHWQELLTPTDAVQSVNGQTGNVVLSIPTVDVTAAGDNEFTGDNTFTSQITAESGLMSEESFQDENNDYITYAEVTPGNINVEYDDNLGDSGTAVTIISDTITVSSWEPDPEDAESSIEHTVEITPLGISVDGDGVALQSDIPTIEANPSVPSGTTPTALTGLELNGDYYEISGGGSVPSNMVTTDTSQTITGEKTYSPRFLTFSNNSGNSCGIWCGSSVTGQFQISGSNLNGLYLSPRWNTPISCNCSAIEPVSPDYTNLGSSISKFNDLYLYGSLKDGTNTISIANIANKSNYTYQTTAPSAAISDGGIHIVYLSSDPATKYSGYIYMIAEN